MNRIEWSSGKGLAHVVFLVLVGVGFVLFGPSEAATASQVVVQVEVSREGQPVTGLASGDFLVRDKKKPVPVIEVLEVGPGTFGEALPDEAFRRVHLLFDLEFSSPRFVMQATDLARMWITPERLTRTEVAIAAHEPSTGLRIEMDPTDDPDRLGEMLDTLRAENERRLAIWAQATGPVVGGDDLIAARARNTESAMGLVQQEQGRILGLIRSLARLEPLTRTVPGGSQVVLFSPGFDSSVILGNATTDRFDAAWSEQQSAAAARGDVAAVGGASRYGTGLVEKALFEMLTDYERSGVAIQAVDIELTGETRMVERGARGPNGLTIMTGQTGGEVFRGSRQDLLEELQVPPPGVAFYLLTFEPLSAPSGRYRKLDIRLKSSSKKITVAAPAGYYVP